MFVDTDHDADRWGTALTDDKEPRSITRIACLVRLRTDARTKPVRRAKAEVLDALAASAPAEWFLFERGDHAKKLRLDDLWCPPNIPPGCVIVLAKEDGQPNALAGWNRIDGRSGWAQFDAAPELLGPKGAIACMRATWADAASTEDLDDDVAGRLAILTSDAVRLFGGLTLVAASRKLVSTHKPGEQWTAAHRDELRAQHKSLTDGPQKLGVEAADAALAEAWKMSPSNVKQQRIYKPKPAKRRAA